MLDIASLGVAFGVVALTLLVLSYSLTYRRTRSVYSAWWCAAIALFFAGSLAYLLHDAHQVWANPLGNTLVVGGAASVWAAACSLRAGRPRAWQLVAGPVLTAIASVVDSPGSNYWAGGPVLLALIFLISGLAAFELWRPDPERTRAQRPLAIAAVFLAGYYFFRWIAFLAGGPDGYVFAVFFNSSVTTLTTLVLLVVASFTMTTLSNEQATRKLHTQATQDGLTGLLNRAGFLDLAADEVRRITRTNDHGSLILADMDHFKTVNDTYGHAAGDSALQAFATACTSSLRTTDLVGRYGGEEFIFLLPGANPNQAEIITTNINRTLKNLQADQAFPLPTVSYGIAPLSTGTQDLDLDLDLDTIIEAADAALYEAKSQGRNRAVQATTPTPASHRNAGKRPKPGE
ncbi:GGDEF domain-containing protein [Arthrobacter sp. Br18]|uniref:GGDEF domain-containing protein n=1 Tax=Arthrobacter sp. Br18 TaxID=1312954 RepID=UPI0031B86720